MSIIQDCYNIFDKEYAKFIAKKSSKNLVVRELSQNLAFLREGLAESLDSTNVVSGLEDKQFKNANDKGANLNSIQKRTLSRNTYGGAREFEKYRGWSTAKMINNAYVSE